MKLWSVRRLTNAAGFRYIWDEPTRQFAHPAGIVVLTPRGQIARYLFGVEYGPRDLRLALLEASDGKVGSKVDSLLLYCYHYDPMTGRRKRRKGSLAFREAAKNNAITAKLIKRYGG